MPEFQYRLSWEMVSPIDAARIVDYHGKEIWPKLNWDDLEWFPTEVLFLEDELESRLDQAEGLKKWSETKEHPVRKVKLEKRLVSPEWTLVEIM